MNSGLVSLTSIATEVNITKPRPNTIEARGTKTIEKRPYSAAKAIVREVAIGETISMMLMFPPPDSKNQV